MQLTDDDRKVLTVYIGERWHEIVAEQPYEIDGVGVGSLFRCSCGQSFHAPINLHTMINLTFTTPADLHAVYSKMVEKGEWSKFRRYAEYQYGLIPFLEPITEDEEANFDIDLEAWLFCLACPEQIPERMKMVAEWIGKRG